MDQDMKKPMAEAEIKEILLKHGHRLFEADKAFMEFTGNDKADQLLNKIEKYPHAFVIACIMDRQMRAEAAWLIPYKLSKRLGDFHFSTLSNLSLGNIKDLMTKPEPLHRFPDEMSKNLYEAVVIIADKYNGDSSRIWTGKPSSAEVVYRFLQFRGVGPKIATMAANALARDFKVPFSNYYSIDISIDLHVRRVLGRLGLAPKGATVEELIYRARALNPEFPGIIDLPTWEIGRNWCKPKQPICEKCYIKDVCPSSNSQHSLTA
jgi:uncharacterized HhH-GPD family protein